MMSDLISRNAVIQKLNTMDRYVSEELILCETDERFPKNEVFIVDDVYEEIVENLPSAQPEPQWIKCSDRLPQEAGEYLIAVEMMDGTYEADMDIFNGKKWQYAKRRDVIAWMPLPQPYRGD